MQIFVSEYVCGGAWPGEQLETSLAREGRAMLTALVEDLSRIPGVRVVTTWDSRLGECPLENCDVRLVHSPLNKPFAFAEQVEQSDAVWIIAPETDGALLSRRIEFDSIVRLSMTPGRQRRFVGATVTALMQTTSKQTLCDLLSRQGISTPETRGFDFAKSKEGWEDWPIIIKPDDGAGSQNTFLVRNGLDFFNAWCELQDLEDPESLIQQPFIPGKALSVALLIAADGSIIEVLPVAEQHLSDDGRFRYLGGRIPADISAESAIAIQQLAQRACRAVPGLTGYVGCDLVLPDVGHVYNVPNYQRPTEQRHVGNLPHEEPVLIEINPRLTTSYLGYRALTDDNIAARLLDPSTPPLRWKSEAVTFTV